MDKLSFQSQDCNITLAEGLEEYRAYLQANGKKRLTIQSDTDSTEKEVYDKVIKEEYFVKNYNVKNIKKTIFIKNRLMNLIIL